MDDLCRYSGRPFAFIFRYVRHRALSHGVIAGAVLAAVACSITTQYGVKYLVDTLSGADRGNGVWFAFALLVSLIAADNLLDAAAHRGLAGGDESWVELTTDDYKHMRRVVGYVHRHVAQRPRSDVTRTRWRYSLLNWGHDPLRPL